MRKISRKENKESWIIVDRLADIILTHNKGCIVDIGIGHSTDVLASYSLKYNREHFSCDVKKRKCDLLKKAYEHIDIFNGKSLDFIDQFPDKKSALVFIDGCHSYELVKKEFYFFLDKIVVGGVIFLHDTNPPFQYIREDGSKCGTVYKLREEIEVNKRLEVFTWPYTANECGLTMVMKKGYHNGG